MSLILHCILEMLIGQGQSQEETALTLTIYVEIDTH